MATAATAAAATRSEDVGVGGTKTPAAPVINPCGTTPPRGGNVGDTGSMLGGIGGIFGGMPGGGHCGTADDIGEFGAGGSSGAGTPCVAAGAESEGVSL